MSDSIDIKPRPQLPAISPAQSLTVAARPNQWGGPAPAENADLRGLVDGLAAFNPALRQLTNNAREEEQRRAEVSIKRDKLGGAGFAQGVNNPRAVLTGQPIEGPSPLPVAVSDTFRDSMREQLAQRAGIENKDAGLAEFGTLKDKPGFNVDQWLQQTRAKALQGVPDPVAATVIGHHQSEMEAEVRSVVRADQLKRAQEVATATVSQQAADMFSPDMTPDAVFEAYPLFRERAKQAGFTPKESAGFLFTRLNDTSNKLGGAPELFDVFDKKDAEGLTLQSRNPHLAPALIEARKQARAMREKALGEAAEQGNAKTLMRLDLDIAERPDTVTPERILSLMTPHGALRSPEQAASVFMRARDSMMKLAATQQLMGLYDSGELWRVEPGQQNKVLDAKLGGAVNALSEATKAGNAEAVAQVGSLILQAHSKSGATVAFDQLKNYVSTLTTNLQPSSGPSPAFNSAVELYKSMSGNPQYRDLYFNEEVSKVLSGYSSAVNNGTDPKAAYTQAYQSVSPEAKAAADAYTRTPDFQKLVAKDAKKYVEGSSWWPRVFGGEGRPDNQAVVGAAIAGAVRAWRANNPFASDPAAEQFAQTWTEKNFVLDGITHAAIKVPPALGGVAAKEAFTEHTREVTKELELGARNDAQWSVQYVPVGTEGNYSVVAFNGSATKAVGVVNLQDMLIKERAKRLISPDEGKALWEMRQGVKSGNPPIMDLKLLAKAQALGALKPEDAKTYRDIAVKTFKERINSIPSLGLDDSPSFDGVQYMARAGKVDKGLTARTALELAASPQMGIGRSHEALAQSLITMGEGVSLTAYDDPASGAGKNIGMGYNLNANAKTVNDDLKRSGVPEERIGDVIAGRAQLTPMQAKRLLSLTLPRYEQNVQDVANYLSPGLWDKMLPQQKAVMIDVAYQVGSVDRFKKAWTALATGKPDDFLNETKVFYINRSGERVEDKRRGTLRANLLAGVPQWEALLEKYSAVPANRTEAAALAAKQ